MAIIDQELASETIKPGRFERLVSRFGAFGEGVVPMHHTVESKPTRQSSDDEYPKVGPRLKALVGPILEKMEEQGGPFIGGGKTARGRWRDATDAAPIVPLIRANIGDAAEWITKHVRKQPKGRRVRDGR